MAKLQFGNRIPADKYIRRTKETERRYYEQQKALAIQKAQAQQKQIQLERNQFLYKDKAIDVPMNIDLTNKSGWRTFDRLLIKEFQKEFGRMPDQKEMKEIDTQATAMYESKFGSASTMGFGKQYKVLRDSKGKVIGYEKEVPDKTIYTIGGVPVSEGVYKKVEKEGFEPLPASTVNTVKDSNIAVRKRYDEATGVMTTKLYDPDTSLFTEKQSFYGFSPMAFGSSSLTSTSVKPKELIKKGETPAIISDILTPEEKPYPWATTKQKVGYHVLETSEGILSAPIMLVPSTLSLTGSILETPSEMWIVGKHKGIGAGAKYLGAKPLSALRNMKLGFEKTPSRFIGNVVGNLAMFKGASIGYQAFTKPSSYRITTSTGIKAMTTEEGTYYQTVGKTTYTTKTLPKLSEGAIVKGTTKTIYASKPMAQATSEISAFKSFKITPEMAGNIPKEVKADWSYVSRGTVSSAVKSAKKGTIIAEPLNPFIESAGKVITEGSGSATRTVKFSVPSGVAIKGKIPILSVREAMIYPVDYEKAWTPSTYKATGTAPKTPLKFAFDVSGESALRDLPSRTIPVKSGGTQLATQSMSSGEIISIGEQIQKASAGKKFLIEYEPIYRTPSTPFVIGAGANIMGTYSGSGTKSISAQKIIQAQPSDLKMETKMTTKPEQSFFNTSDITSKQITGMAITPVQSQLPAQDISQQQKQLIDLRRSQQLKRSFYRTKTTVPFLPLTRTHGGLMSASKKGFFGDSKMEKGFSLFVKSKGRFELVGKPMSRMKAMDIGAEIIDRTASAQFKLVPSDKMVKKEKGTGYYERTSGKYRPYKIRHGARIPMDMGFIEKKGLSRLDTFGEKQGITFKGLMMNRRRRL